MELTTRLVTAFVGLAALSFGLSVANASLADDARRPIPGETRPSIRRGSRPTRSRCATRRSSRCTSRRPTAGGATSPCIRGSSSRSLAKTAFTRQRRRRLARAGGGSAQLPALLDGLWYGERPQLLVDHRGEGVDAMIGEIEAAIASYPYADTYRVHPGPNSNTLLGAHRPRSASACLICRPTRSARTTGRSRVRLVSRPREAGCRRRSLVCWASMSVWARGGGQFAWFELRCRSEQSGAAVAVCRAHRV